MKNTKEKEHYLKEILRLEMAAKTVSVSCIAEVLGVSKSSVSNMIKKLVCLALLFISFEGISQENKTKRVTAPALENILYEAMPALDHGFVRVVDYMGDDTSIVQSARVSYGKGTKKVSTDAGLIKYLMRHWHSTPFEMCEIKYHVKLPIFIARQWIRHRTANVNEYSARYSILDKEFYIQKFFSKNQI